MKRKSAVIVDDERAARRELIFLLGSFPEIIIIGEADNLDNAVTIISEKHPDIVFLDIQLTGENGFDLLTRVTVNFKIIFVTAFNEYALRAFDVNAFDYLMKPVDPERLAQSLSKLFINEETTTPETKKISYNDTIYLKLNNHTSKFVELSSIIAITSIGNYSRLETTFGNKYLVLKTLKQWKKELPDNYFIGIHRSTIVNIRYITKIETYSKIYHRAYMQNIAEPFDISRICFKNIRKLNL
jgi:two-component system, LytTR family, response regulator